MGVTKSRTQLSDFLFHTIQMGNKGPCWDESCLLWYISHTACQINKARDPPPGASGKNADPSPADTWILD